MRTMRQAAICRALCDEQRRQIMPDKVCDRSDVMFRVTLNQVRSSPLRQSVGCQSHLLRGLTAYRIDEAKLTSLVKFFEQHRPFLMGNRCPNETNMYCFQRSGESYRLNHYPFAWMIQALWRIEPKACWLKKERLSCFQKSAWRLCVGSFPSS